VGRDDGSLSGDVMPLFDTRFVISDLSNDLRIVDISGARPIPSQVWQFAWTACSVSHRRVTFAEGVDSTAAW
jgi:hypothetical protein